MEHKTTKRMILLTIAVTLLSTGSANAVIIPLLDSGWALLVAHPASQEISVPAIDIVGGDTLVIEIRKTFSIPSENGLFQPMIFEFQKIADDATANIVINGEYITNNTGSEWFGFHMSLLVDISEPEAGFDPDFLPDGDQFEDVYYAMGYGYNGLPVQLNFADTNGNGVPSSPAGEDIFWPGYTAGKIVIVTDPTLPRYARFGLRGIPSTTTPEPATMMLLGIGGLVVFKRRKKGQTNISIRKRKK